MRAGRQAITRHPALTGCTKAAPQPHRYTGAYLDPTGLYKCMGHRYYDPTLGRFTQPDPSGQETNAYLYAAGDPVNNTDPAGLWTGWDTVATAFATVALITAIPTGGASLTVAGGIGLAVSQAGFVGAVACGVSDENAWPGNGRK
ncbi:RHS repeat-associated core domain-containing protein [Streptomyces sp. NPDC012474]|uniref:RHS repeat-associated core domain-containing protein n=1 Tax=Streptomyces sp. NPDC012474 TaxID=3364836 RepID=UPI0036E33F24